MPSTLCCDMFSLDTSAGRANAAWPADHEKMVVPQILLLITVLSEEAGAARGYHLGEVVYNGRAHNILRCDQDVEVSIVQLVWIDVPKADKVKGISPVHVVHDAPDPRQAQRQALHSNSSLLLLPREVAQDESRPVLLMALRLLRAIDAIIKWDPIDMRRDLKGS